jgi:hypothetical protein
MLLLFETAAGLALFKVLKEDKIKESDDVGADFASLDQAQKVFVCAVQLLRLENSPQSAGCLFPACGGNPACKRPHRVLPPSPCHRW